MITPLILLGTFWFWAYFIIPFIFLIWFVESEQSVLAAVVVAGMTAAFLAFGDPTVLSAIQANPFILVPYFVGYVVAGVTWGFVKWFFYVLKKRDEYAAEVAEWQEAVDRHEKNGVPENRRAQKPSLESYRPQASRNKGRIVFWMAYWPASGLWTLLNDPLTRLFNFIYRQLGKAFDRISQSLFAKFEA